MNDGEADDVDEQSQHGVKDTFRAPASRRDAENWCRAALTRARLVTVDDVQYCAPSYRSLQPGFDAASSSEDLKNNRPRNR